MLPLTRLLVVAWTILVVPSTLLPAPPAAAQAKPIDPSAITLTPHDLPVGFTVDAANSGYENLPEGMGLQLRTQLTREASPENVLSGPIIVSQVVVRVDHLIAPTDLLAVVRDQLVQRQGLSPVPGAPNDGGTVSLEKKDGEVATYAVGFAKDNFVVFTIWGGLDSVVNLPGLLELSGITSARYDSVKGS